MSQIVYRGNLSAKAIPFLTDFQGRSVIVPGPDDTFNRSLVSSEDNDRDVGKAVAYYAHNILPAGYGFQSVGYESLIPPVGGTSFNQAELLRSNKSAVGVNGPRFYFSPLPAGTNYILQLGSVAWAASATPIIYPTGTQITFATVQGISYIFFANLGCYKYNSATNTFIPVVLTGLIAANILGITAYQGYLIAYDNSTVYWSSTLDIDYTLNAVDFTPSLVTGAGSLTLEGAKGPIVFITPATFGIACYTSANIVSGVYSGNSRYPFNFREIVSSGGGISLALVAYDANTGSQYAYTTSGLQLLTATATSTVFPEATDFLAGQDFEDYDEATFAFSQTVLSTPMQKRLTAIADRYLVFSYGISSLTHAIVYDMAQKRWGKLKITHVDCFEYEYLEPLLADSPRKSIAFLKSDGSIEIANLSITFADSVGVLLLGKFQYVRSRLLTLEELIIQNIHPLQSCSVYDLYSVDGGTIDSVSRVQGYETSVSGQHQRTYKFHVTGANHSIMLVGGFYLSSFVLAFHINGKR